MQHREGRGVIFSSSPFTDLNPSTDGKDFFSRHKITLERYIWARAVQFSRAVQVTTSSGVPLHLLPPQVDRLNHASKFDSNCQIELDETSQRVVVLATRDVGAGEELLVHYGEATNTRHGLGLGLGLGSRDYTDVPTRLGVVVPRMASCLPHMP